MMDSLDKAAKRITDYLRAQPPDYGGCKLHSELTITVDDVISLSHAQVHRLMFHHDTCIPSLACISEVLAYEGYDE